MPLRVRKSELASSYEGGTQIGKLTFDQIVEYRGFGLPAHGLFEDVVDRFTVVVCPTSVSNLSLTEIYNLSLKLGPTSGLEVSQERLRYSCTMAFEQIALRFEADAVVTGNYAFVTLTYHCL